MGLIHPLYPKPRWSGGDALRAGFHEGPGLDPLLVRILKMGGPVGGPGPPGLSSTPAPAPAARRLAPRAPRSGSPQLSSELRRGPGVPPALEVWRLAFGRGRGRRRWPGRPFGMGLTLRLLRPCSACLRLQRGCYVSTLEFMAGDGAVSLSSSPVCFKFATVIGRMFR